METGIAVSGRFASETNSLACRLLTAVCRAGSLGTDNTDMFHTLWIWILRLTVLDCVIHSTPAIHGATLRVVIDEDDAHLAMADGLLDAVCIERRESNVNGARRPWSEPCLVNVRD